MGGKGSQSVVSSRNGGKPKENPASPLICQDGKGGAASGKPRTSFRSKTKKRENLKRKYTKGRQENDLLCALALYNTKKHPVRGRGAGRPGLIRVPTAGQKSGFLGHFHNMNSADDPGK